MINFRGCYRLIFFIVITFFCATVSFSLENFNNDMDIGVSLYKKGAYLLALEQFNKIIIDNENVQDRREVYFYLAQSYRQLAENEKAREYYRLVLSSMGQKYSDSSLYYLGQLAYEQKEYDQCIKNMLDFEKKYPHSEHFYYAKYWLAQSYYVLGDRQRAKLNYAEILSGLPRFEYEGYIKYALGRIYFKEKKYRQATQMFFSDAVRREPSLGDGSLFYGATAYYNSNNKLKALEHFSLYLDKYPSGKFYFETNAMLAKIYYREKRYDKAILYYKELVASSSYIKGGYWGLVNSYYNIGQYDDSLEVLDKFIALEKDSGKLQNAIYKKAVILNKKSSYQESSNLIDQIKIDVVNQKLLEKMLYLRITNFYQMAGWNEVLSDSLRYLSDYPNSKNLDLVLLYRGIAQKRTRQLDAALETLEKIKDKNYLIKAKYFMAQLKKDKGQASEAATLYKEVLSGGISPDYISRSLHGLGSVYFINKEYSQSLKTFDDFTSKYPNHDFSMDAYYKKGLCYLGLYQYANAYNQFDYFRKNYPLSEENESALYYAGYSLYQMEQFSQAIGLFEEVKFEQNSGELFENTIFYMGKSFFRLEQWDRCIVTLSKMLNVELQYVLGSEIYLIIGDSYFNKGEYQSAIKYYREGSKRYASQMWVKNLDYGVILALYKDAKFDLAKKELEFFDKKYKESALVEKILLKIKRKQNK